MTISRLLGLNSQIADLSYQSNIALQYNSKKDGSDDDDMMNKRGMLTIGIPLALSLFGPTNFMTKNIQGKFWSFTAEALIRTVSFFVMSFLAKIVYDHWPSKSKN